MKNKSTFILLAFLFICLFTNTAHAQSNCNNLDFEDHHWTNWNGYLGINSGMNQPMNNVVAAIDSASGSTLSRHLLITIPSLDSLCTDSASGIIDPLMNKLNPYGGSASIRLGNSGANSEMESLTYQLQVNDSFFCYSYATVQEQPNHSMNDQPYFKVIVTNAAGNYIAGACDSFYVGNPNVPFISSGVTWASGIKYRRWSTNCLNLSAYIGQTVTIKFINADCALGGHFAYTYLDVSCLSGSTLTGAVWPGDCNNDHIADMTDIVALGIANGATGPMRTSASNAWTAQNASDWTGAFPLGANYKHADTNGDGMVNLADTTAILLNYGLTHPKPASTQSGNPELQLSAINANIAPGAFADFDVLLGSVTSPVNTIYGLAFSINLDTSKLDMSFTPQLTYNNSWLGINQIDVINIAKHHLGEDYIQMGIAKLNHINATGYGPIARLRIKTKSTLANNTPIHVSLSGLSAFDFSFAEQGLSLHDGLAVISTNVGITNLPSSAVAIYPNPAQNIVIIDSYTNPIHAIKICDLLGKEFYNTTSSIERTTVKIPLTSIPNGVYLVQITLENGTQLSKKLLVQH